MLLKNTEGGVWWITDLQSDLGTWIYAIRLVKNKPGSLSQTLAVFPPFLPVHKGFVLFYFIVVVFCSTAWQKEPRACFRAGRDTTEAKLNQRVMRNLLIICLASKQTCLKVLLLLPQQL